MFLLFILADMLLFYGGLQNGFNPYQHKPIEYAKKIDIPTLLLYGEKDERVTIEETKAIYENLSGKKSIAILKNSAHENYLNNDEEHWSVSVAMFFSE